MDWDGGMSTAFGLDDFMGGGSVSLRHVYEKPNQVEVHRNFQLGLGQLKKSKKLAKRIGGVDEGESTRKGVFGFITFIISMEPIVFSMDAREPYYRWLTVDVLEGHKLCPLKKKGSNDTVVNVMVGGHKVKNAKNNQITTKPVFDSLNPKWGQRFEFQLTEGQYSVTFTVNNKTLKKDQQRMGRVLLPLRDVSGFRYFDQERGTEMFRLPLHTAGGLGEITVALAISDYLREPTKVVCKSCGTPSASLKCGDPKCQFVDEKARQFPAYLLVTVLKASNLRAADGVLKGSSDPFTVVEIGPQRKRTKTVKNSLQPIWEERVMEFCIRDVFASMDVTVYDQDDGGKQEFLGRVRIPLLQIQPGIREITYALKDKKCLTRAQGEIRLRLDFMVFDEWKARMGIFEPRYMIGASLKVYRGEHPGVASSTSWCRFLH